MLHLRKTQAVCSYGTGDYGNPCSPLCVLLQMQFVLHPMDHLHFDIQSYHRFQDWYNEPMVFPVNVHRWQYIQKTIQEFYSENYEDLMNENPELIKQAISGLQQVYHQNIFPEMKVRWDAYPNNIGHLEFNGCFRCHNDLHKSEDDHIISKDCNLCHTIVAQGSPDDKNLVMISETLEFKHPRDIDEAWKEMFCTECHTGLNP